MISISMSDILKALEQIPIWKAVVGLPKRVAELERRLEALEGKTAGAAAKSDPKACAICGSTLKVTQELPHPDFEFAGMKVHKMECPDCGTQTTRDFSPAKGYQ